MSKQISWIKKENNNANYIATKEVDFTTFVAGFDVAKKFYNQIISNISDGIQPGITKWIKIGIDDILYNCQIVYSNQNKLGIRLRKDEELMKLLKNKLSLSYNYITNKKGERHEGKIELPDDCKEYIDIYKGDAKDIFIFELISKSSQKNIIHNRALDYSDNEFSECNEKNYEQISNNYALIEEVVIKELENKNIEIINGGTERMKKLITQSERMNIESIEKKVNRGNIVLDPTFQRNYVYTDEKAASVIQSILLNMPLGVVYLAEIDNKNLCVDGQQRLTSIIRFINNKFPLKKLDVLTELGGLYFKDLNDDMKDIIYDYSMEITKIKECDYEQIYFLYEKLNVGSVKLNAQEIRRCVYAGYFNDMLEEIVEEGIVEKYFSEIDNNRLKRVEVLINALSFADNPNYKCSRKKLLNDYMEKHKNDDEKTVENQRNNIVRIFRLIEHILGDKAFKFKDKESLTLTLVYPIYSCFSNLNERDLRFNADSVREAIINITQADVCIFNPNGNVNGDPKGVKYTLDKIEKVIKDAIGDNCDTRMRNFPKEWREILFDKQEGICGICSQKILNINNAEIDHIIPFSQGGDSALSNAQLTHMHCNRSKNNRV
ncbi:DUF262 domain-containing protein [Clostridium chromiireducens]|uniref:DUF262 domain-containing protein n=1 Tax=Clostridium chromiireducens TaxID=225345 RepID=A0A964RRH1_9CLOT|nr:DUF262 domain-containing protein [Clostridium chromiireducens]MVX66476.1 DUF262 domain-containing protein [Clostridium chromiireducens]